LGEENFEESSEAQKDASVKVMTAPVDSETSDSGIHKVSIICRLCKFDSLKKALNELGVTGMTMTQVMGSGIQKGSSEMYRGIQVDSTLLPKVKVEVIVSKIPVDKVIDTAKKALYTGHIGDGKIFVYNVIRAVKVRTGEEGYDAIRDVE
jgi:Amt family ammonium transporter